MSLWIHCLILFLSLTVLLIVTVLLIFTCYIHLYVCVFHTELKIFVFVFCICCKLLRTSNFRLKLRECNTQKNKTCRATVCGTRNDWLLNNVDVLKCMLLNQSINYWFFVILYVKIWKGIKQECMWLEIDVVDEWIYCKYSTFSFVTHRDVNESHAAQPLSAVV